MSDVHFSYFDRTMKSNYCKNGETISITGHTKGGVKLHVSRRDPYTKIGAGKLDTIVVNNINLTLTLSSIVELNL